MSTRFRGLGCKVRFLQAKCRLISIQDLKSGPRIGVPVFDYAAFGKLPVTQEIRVYGYGLGFRV